MNGAASSTPPGGAATPASTSKNRNTQKSVPIAEIADVEVTKYVFGLSEEDNDFINDVIGFKLTRWAERLKKKEERR